jgi:hypothetical protein
MDIVQQLYHAQYAHMRILRISFLKRGARPRVAARWADLSHGPLDGAARYLGSGRKCGPDEADDGLSSSANVRIIAS